MFIVTNREVNPQRKGIAAFGASPNPKGPNELRVAEATRVNGKWQVDILPDVIPPAMAKAHQIEAPTDPATGKPGAIYASRYLGRKVLERVNPGILKVPGTNQKMPGTGRNLVFFVHGFNNDVKAVLDRAETFEQMYGVEVVAFSWPANGGGVSGVASYKDDKRDALASSGALDRTLVMVSNYLQEIHAQHVKRVEKIANERYANDGEAWDKFFTAESQKWCPFKITLVAHSMGNYLFKNLLKSSTYHGGLLLFDNVVLVAADTNNDAHADWVDSIQCRGRIFVTINEEDGALKASRMKMGEEQKARLGHYTYGLDSKRAVYVDFTRADGVGDSHAYFEGDPIRKNSRVRDFFQQALNGKPAEAGLAYDVARNLHWLP